jgi:lipid-binding SYLF domain-containing protein
MNRRLLLLGSVTLGGLALTGCAESRKEMHADERTIVNQALTTVQVMKAHGGTKIAMLLQKAKAVVIFPDILKGGIGLGGSRGQGVMLVHGPQGWSYPAFYETTSVSLGVQLGFEESSVVMFVMKQRALDTLMQASNFTLKAGGGFTFVDFNKATEAELEGADVVIWSKSEGAFAGLTLSGSDVSQRLDLDQSYYGKPVNAAEIAKGMVRNPQAGPLRAALSG